MRHVLTIVWVGMFGVFGCHVDRTPYSQAEDASNPTYSGPPEQEAADGGGVDSGRDDSNDTSHAELVIHELNANIDLGCDLVEFYVTKAGALEGVLFKERTKTVFTWEQGEVPWGTFIIVHFNAMDLECNPAMSGSEMNAPDEYSSALYTGNFDNAYDVYVEDDGLVATDNVLTLYNADGSIMDAIFVSDAPLGSTAQDTDKQAAEVAAHGQWTTSAGEVPLTGFMDDVFNMHAVHDLDATSTVRLGASIQRKMSIDHNHRDDWFSEGAMPEATWGEANPF